jgi:hypothetical protein
MLNSKENPHLCLAVSAFVVLLCVGIMAFSLGVLHYEADVRSHSILDHWPDTFLTRDIVFMNHVFARFYVFMFIAASAVLAHFAARFGQLLYLKFKRF